MVQTLKSQNVYTGWKVILLEKPRVLTRIFFSIRVLTDLTMGHKSLISFDDPTFALHYILDGPVQHLEAKGEGVFQGNIWARNDSTDDLIFVLNEILI